MLSVFRNAARHLLHGRLASNRVSFTSKGLSVNSDLLGRAGSGLFYRYPALFTRDIPLSNLLLGGVNNAPAALFARMTGQLRLPSTRIADSPHAALFREYRAAGERTFEPAAFAQSPYWHYAKQCIGVYGQFFDATTLDQVIERARRICRSLNGEEWRPVDERESKSGAPVLVRRIRFSNCYEIIDGHHRLAMACVNGKQSHRCAIVPLDAAITPLQQLVFDSSWTEGEPVVYQPIDLPELAEWPLARICTDRFEMIRAVLRDRGLQTGSYLDIGCSYGWFVGQMAKLGYEASGIDRDAAAISLGQIVFGLDKEQVNIGDIGRFLASRERPYDIVSCFSILHHYVLGRNSISAADLIHLIDNVTRSVLFLDMGEEHEAWFATLLAGWNADSIRKWLLENTTFNRVEVLGRDQDARGIYRTQYRRHLFACYRD